MITKRVVIDQREITASGIIQVRFRKEIVEDGVVLSFEYHRTSLRPGDDLDKQMEWVNNHLQQMGFPAAEGVESIRRIMQLEHTREAIASFKAAQRSLT